MSQTEFIELIPQILLYIIPGFFTLKEIEAYGPRKKMGQMETILWSIFFSFLVALMVGFLKWIWGGVRIVLLSLNLEAYLKFLKTGFGNTMDIGVSLILACLLGWLWIHIQKNKLGAKIVELMNANMEPGVDFWFEVMKAEEGAWAIVYMKDGMVYRGKLIKYTADANEPTKMMLLSNFSTQIRREKPLQLDPPGTESRYALLRDETPNDHARVLLRYDDVLSVELCRGVEKKEEQNMDK